MGNSVVNVNMNNARQIVALLLETDLVEAVPAVVDQVVRETGFTFNPNMQAGGIDLTGLSPEETSILTRNVSWEFTDKRPDSPTVGFTFYVKANTPYEQIMQTYQQRLAKWKEDAASVEKRKRDWERNNPAFRSSIQ